MPPVHKRLHIHLDTTFGPPRLTHKMRDTTHEGPYFATTLCLKLTRPWLTTKARNQVAAGKRKMLKPK